MRITTNEIRTQIAATNQVHFELVALRNFVAYEEPYNAKNMNEALDHVYNTLEANRAAFNSVIRLLTNGRDDSIEIEKARIETRRAWQTIDDQSRMIQKMTKQLTKAREQVAAYKHRALAVGVK